ncbi:hypothetical protein SAMN05443248_0294 [Bradyrhizobium erythrophlei]|uniref:Uncharacterized protein n=2 Tax=Bradyrhizobium erythrophlei TaxID=1437360 RepID=A0A1M5H3K1_9BRAD|nr:hypothetical protein SAMN05443248_0294 [Bradyrhizobium erythrophlei]
MIEDLNLDRDDDGKPPPGPAFMVGEPLPDRELLIAERCFREAARDYPGSGLVMFTMIDEATGEEGFDTSLNAVGQRSAGQVTEAERWRRIMNWPVDPTVAEVMAFKANADARAQAALWYMTQPAPPVS